MADTKQRASKGLTPAQRLFADAIDYNALHKAMQNDKSRKEIMAICAKIKY